MNFEDEILIDEELKTALDAYFLAIENVTIGELFGGVSYLLNGQAFAILMEGVIALRVAPENLQVALTLAGVSPFRPPSLDNPVQGWLQFLLLLPEDVSELALWYESAMAQVK